MAANTLCLKNDTTLRCYNSDSHKAILIIFGRNVPERVENHLTSASAVSGETENPEIALFSLKCCITALLHFNFHSKLDEK